MPRTKSSRYQQIVVAGNIGVGKSSFAEAYAEMRGFGIAREPVSDNPYLAEFYQDMKRWAFHSQIFFLAHRLKQHAGLGALARSGVVVQDRSLYEDAEIFARNLADTGVMEPREYQTYCEVYAASKAMLAAPSLVVYLRASVATLTARIEKRGRDYERAIDAAYLARLNKLYDAWAKSFGVAPVMTIETDDLDFVANARDREALFAKVDRERAAAAPV